MKRGESGRYEVTNISGEHVRAFVPAPLPPKPNLVLDGSPQQMLEAAVLALGRLDGVATLLPDETLFLYARGVVKLSVLYIRPSGTRYRVHPPPQQERLRGGAHLGQQTRTPKPVIEI